MMLQGVGLAKETGMGYRRGEEGKASLLGGQWDLNPLPRSGFLPPLQVHSLPVASGAPLHFCFSGIYSQKHLTLPARSKADSCKHRQCCFLVLRLALWQLLLRRNEYRSSGITFQTLQTTGMLPELLALGLSVIWEHLSRRDPGAKNLPVPLAALLLADISLAPPA